jgi:general secretion pathway protein I
VRSTEQGADGRDLAAMTQTRWFNLSTIRPWGASGGEGCAGFTLVEVLVALVLMATSLAVMGSLFAVKARATVALERHLALIETARFVAATLPKREQLSSGAVGETSGHRWRLDLLPFVDPDTDRAATPWNPQRLVISVRSPSGSLFHLETIRLQKRTER